jgi:hypothetical protein
MVWASYTRACGSAATTLCTEILFFCSPDHFERQRGTRTESDGRLLAAEEAFQIGKALFGDRMLLGTTAERSPENPKLVR